MGHPAERWRGNKAELPGKFCAACGRWMSWRAKWARNWDTVRYCSDACRRQRSRVQAAPDSVDSTQPSSAGSGARRPKLPRKKS